jgi:hypothetical protein
MARGKKADVKIIQLLKITNAVKILHLLKITRLVKIDHLVKIDRLVKIHDIDDPQKNTGISINLRFSKSTAIKPVTIKMGDPIFKAYGAPSSWTMRDDTPDDELIFVPPATPE